MEPAGFFAAITAVVIAFLCIVYRFLNKNYDIKNTTLPKVSSFFPLGSWYGMWSKVIGEVDLKNLKENGKLFWTFDGTKANLFVADLDLIKCILTDKADSYCSYRAQRVGQPILKGSLENIGKHNVKFNSIFNEENIRKLMPRIQRSADVLVQSLQSKDPTTSTYIQPHIMQYVGDVIAMTIFGIDLYSNEYKDQRTVFMENINKVFKVQNPTSFSSILPYIQNTKALDNSILPADATKYFVDLCHSIIESKRATTAQTGAVEGKALDLIDILIESLNDMIEKKDGSSDYVEEISFTEQLKSTITTQCLSIILYTVRSTEAGLTQSAHILAEKQGEQAKLFEEINKFHQSTGVVLYDQVCLEAKNLDVFLKEIQRLYPVEYRLVRDLKKEVEIGDVTVDEGMSITIPIYAIHHNEDFYEEPMLFKPERFIDNDKMSSDKYLPYGEASSNPLFAGIQLGNLFIKMGLAHVIRKFKLLPPSQEFQAPLDFAKGLTEVPVTMPVFVKICQAEEDQKN